ncbi:MAG: hypothetical protein K2M79_04405 [Muribaculaceae bacterium]|nr:hypothetical protein [Muribaculaceae bacterium]
MKTKSAVYWIIIVSFGVLFYILNYFTPFQHDDFAYAFYYAADSSIIRPTSTPVTWETLLPSMWHHYCYVNGRFTSHILIQIFCGLLGKGIFNVLNTLVFMWFLHLVVEFTGRKSSVIALCATIVTVFLFFPFPAQTMLWLTGAINYLWTTTFSLAILSYIKNNITPSKSISLNVIAFLLGLIVGWMQESITVGISAGLFLWFVFFSRQSFMGTNATLSLGLWLGTLLLIFSPGTYHRITTGEELMVEANILQLIVTRLWTISLVLAQQILPVIACIICVIIVRSKGLRKELSLPALVFLMLTSFVYALGMPEDRIFYGLITYALVLVLCYFRCSVRVRAKSLRYTFVIIALAVSAYNGVTAITAVREYSTYFTDLMVRVKYGKENVIEELPQYSKNNKWVLIAPFSNDKYDFHNRVMAFYYHKVSVQFLSPRIYSLYKDSAFNEIKQPVDMIASYNGTEYNVFRLPETGLFMIELDKETIPAHEVIAYHKIKDNSASLTNKQLIIRYLFNTLNPRLKCRRAFCLSDANGSYLLFPEEADVTEILLK